MIKSTTFCLLCSGWFAMANAETSQSFSVGEAFAMDSEELLYRETHCQNDDNLKRIVFYNNPEGESIAYKSIDYRNGFSTPSFEQISFHTGEKTAVTIDDNVVTLSYTDSNNEQTQKRFEKNKYSDLPMVIDAGFDAYIRENWDNLVSGVQQKFQFPLVTRSALVELQVSASNCSYQTKDNQCFKLEMSNWLYRMLASPIELGYSRQNRQLMRYRGLSNIEDENGDGLNVDIRYAYGEKPLPSCPFKGTPEND